MKELTYFYLKSCPYCKRATSYIEELISENPEFKNIKINMIEEKENSELANSYDYYYVPCFWIGKEKIFEGAATKNDINEVLLTAVKGPKVMV